MIQSLLRNGSAIAQKWFSHCSEMVQPLLRNGSAIAQKWFSIWINNEVWVGVGQIDPKGSGSLPKTAKSSRAKMFVSVWKVSAFSNLSAIFVVLITWHKQTNQHQENVLLGLLLCPTGCSPCKNVLLWLHNCPTSCSPTGLCPGSSRAYLILNELENQ